MRCIESGRGHRRRGRAVLCCIVVLSTDFSRGNPNRFKSWDSLFYNVILSFYHYYRDHDHLKSTSLYRPELASNVDVHLVVVVVVVVVAVVAAELPDDCRRSSVAAAAVAEGRSVFVSVVFWSASPR